MPTPTVLLFHLLMQFMCRNLKIWTLPVSTLKHYFSFTAHFDSSETILMYCTGLVSYILDSIRLVHFGPPSRTAYFAVLLVSICAYFEFNSYCVTHGGIPLIPFLVTTRVSNFPNICTLPWKSRLVCIDYPLWRDQFVQHVIWFEEVWEIGARV